MKVAIGIDIGGTNIKVGLINRAGQLLQENNISVKECPSQNILFKELKNSIHSLNYQLDNIELAGIGIGSPGANVTTGVIENASNLPWDKLPIVEFLINLFNVPTYLTNDANLFAIGEKVFGDARHMNDFVVVTLGTGVGAGIYCNGSLLQGRDGLAGEFGHVIVQKDGRPCQCGRKGCLERYTSASGLMLTAQEILNSEVVKSSTLQDQPIKELTSIQVMEAAASGDFMALEIFRVTGKVLGEALADLTAYLNPEAIFLAGGLAKAGSFLFEPTIQSFKENLLSIYPKDIPILQGSIQDNHAGVLGAAALVWDSEGQFKKIHSSVI